MVSRGALLAILAIALLLVPAALGRSLATPLPPVEVQATATAAGVVVAWSPPLYDGGHPVLSYTILRISDPLHPTWEEVGSTDATTTSWTDAAISGVLYAVTANNEAGPSPQSEPASTGSMSGCYPVVVQLSPFGWGINKDCMPIDIRILFLNGGD